MVNVSKKFFVFSSILFLAISLGAFAAYIFSARQINRTYVQQQLTVAAETIKLHLAIEVSSELALISKVGYSPIIREFFMNPEDPALKAYALAEFELFQEYSSEGLVFWINDIEKMFHATGIEPYFVDADDPENYWYNLTLHETDEYNFNINYNNELDMINLWINIPVFAYTDDYSPKTLGMIGTGLNLTKITQLVEAAHRERSRYITAYLFNQFREITSATDMDLITNKVLLTDHLGDAGKEAIRVVDLIVDGRGQNYIYGDYMYRVGVVPAIKDWNILVRYPLPGLLALNRPINIVFFGMLSLILVLFAVINIFVARSERALREQNIQLIEANKNVELASRAKSDFLATMSHEIRTPMNVIIGIAQIQMQKKDLPNEFINALEKIYSSGSSLLGIINDILDMSKIETGKMELNAIEYDVPSLINDAVQLNIVRVGSKPIEFILDIDENLPSKLCGDELRLKQILNNLLSNSIKYTEKGHVKLSVRHTPQGEKTKLHFIIEDTGQGMKPEDIERVFSEYSRFNIEVNRTTEGTGIGLTITQNLVNLMDGTIEVESEYGKGSIFTVTVCQKAVECEAIGHELSQKLRNFTFTGGRQTMRLQILYEPMPYGKILIVDDVETNLYVAEGLMLPYELKIETAISGLKAIEKIESGQTYDIIFMDHMMPLMDGIEATQKLRAMGYGGVVVALTANALAGNDEMFKQKGFDGFIPKPIDARYLDTVLHQYVRDRYPEEAKKYKPFVKEAEVKTLEITPKMLEIFRRDVEKAVKTLQETHASGNIKLFTTTAHAMKSALENIGEKEKAKAALALEEAGIKGDLDYISSYINNFLQTLEQLKKDLIPAESGMDGADIIEDTACLAQQLQVIKNACGAYDDTAAYAALDLLKEKQWKPQTYATLESLRDKLFLHSDFDDAAKQAGELLGRFTQEEKEV